MKCKKIKELLSSYIDGELKRDDIIEVEHHLDGCEDCSDLLRDYQSIRVMLKDIEFPAPSKRIEERILGYRQRRIYFSRVIFGTSLLVVLGALLIPFYNPAPMVVEEEPKEYYMMKEERTPYMDIVYEKEGNFILTNYEGGSF